jgi:hypothetical protein
MLFNVDAKSEGVAKIEKNFIYRNITLSSEKIVRVKNLIKKFF